MGPTRFDALLRVLSASPSRRAALRLAGALAFGGAAAASIESASAKRCPECKKKKGRKCKKAPDDTPCSVGVCKDGRCVCAPQCGGKTCGDPDGCGGKCITNQGCSAGQTCSSQGQCQTQGCSHDSDCCPADRPGCASETLGIYKFCANGACVCAAPNRPQYPAECVFPPDPSQCHECCVNDDCVVKTSDPNRICFFGNCTCGGDKPTLCVVRVEGGAPYCTDPTGDPENCSPFLTDCGVKCAPGAACVNGQCVVHS